MYIYIHIYMYICMYISLYLYIYIHIYINICVRKDIHIHTQRSASSGGKSRNDQSPAPAESKEEGVDQPDIYMYVCMYVYNKIYV